MSAAVPAEWQPGSTRGSPGFFRVAASLDGQWWFVSPDDCPLFVRAVHGVSSEALNGLMPSPAAAVRLREWGFNAVGIGGDGAERDDGLPFFGTVNFCRCGPLIAAPAIRVPDVFGPEWPHRASEYATLVCAGWANTRELMGWFSDDEIAWGDAVGGNAPSLLQVCLSLEPAFAAYHAAWEFVLAAHGGRLEALARGWGVPLPNKEVVRELTRADTAITTRGHARDASRWLGEFARRYFQFTSAAVRAADPNHLFCGCRLRTPLDPSVLARAVSPALDLAVVPWEAVPTVGTASGPILAGEVGWTDEGPHGPARETNTGRQRGSLTSIERTLRRGRLALRRLARHPAVVGYVWRQWHDDPGDQPPYGHGLIHRNGIEAREHTELLADFNRRADIMRRNAAQPSSS